MALKQKVRPPKGFDDNLEWTEEDFAEARPALDVLAEQGLKPPQRGRPAKPEGARKVSVTLRLDPEIVQTYKATGRGWQSLMNEDLGKAAKRRKKAG